jgi:hypothetical protein
MAISNGKHNIIYSGSDNLHKSIDSGATWTNSATPVPANYIEAKNKTAIAMQVAPSDVNGNILYVSTSPFAQADLDVDSIIMTGNPNLMRTLTGGLPMTSVMTGLPNRFVTDIAISPSFSDSVFVSLGGFGTSHVYVTGDKGATWAALSATGLPDVPFNAILIDAIDPKILYVGTDVGVYVSPNRGVSWLDFNTGIWDAAQIVDIQPTANGQLVAATHGKGAFTGPRYTVVLPLTFIEFKGSAENNMNKLELNVNDEGDIVSYEVERSKNGSTFNKVGTIWSNNNPGKTVYTYNDIVSDNITYYYRMKAINLDRSYTYSKIIFIKRYSKEGFKIIGNPFTDKIQMEITAEQLSNSIVNLYDGNGKLIQTLKLKVFTGTNNYDINNLHNLAIGAYYIEAIINEQKWKQKLIKNK